MTAEQKVTRKLRAILSADVKGYSTLMTNDEVSTIQTLKKYRNVMSGIITDHSGNVVDMPGDSVMAEFSSVVNAVKSSVAIQKTLKSRNEDLPSDKRLEFRIGINIGDVVQDGSSLYGEGVNIAARIEGLADPGGICISRGSYDHIRNKLNLGYEYIGEHSVKNIKNPVRVYKVLMAPEDAGKLIGDTPKPQSSIWIFSTIIVAAVALTLFGYQLYQRIFSPELEPASIERMALPLPEKPSIAVLAFDNMSGDQKQEYFCDGLAEEIIAALSSVPELFVIARNSSFSYKGKPVKIQQISEELGVQYILEGSIRKSGENMRITVQLIDALNGNYLWAEHYDRKTDHAIDLQEEIATKVITELQVKVMGRENLRLREPCSQNSKAYLKYLKALGHARSFAKEDNLAARRLAEEAIDLDPDYACAYSFLGGLYWRAAALGSSQNPRETLLSAIRMVNKAIELKPSYAGPHAMLSRIRIMMRQYEQAFIEAEKALNMDSNCQLANFSMGYALVHAGKPGEAIPFIKKAIRLDPFSTPYLYALGASYFLNGQYEEAIQTSRKVLNQNPKFFSVWKILAASYSAIDRMEEARAAAASILEFEPNFTLEKYSKKLPYKNPADKELIIRNLRKAGLPDKPSIPLPNKPSIAVLPFENMSGDPEQDYFSDGLTIDIITDLAKISGLFVISKQSSFRYKGQVVDIKQLGKTLGVHYLLEGSVRRAENSVRINAQLIDTANGAHLWSVRYDRELKDVFNLQNEIINKIVTALEVKLVVGEQAKFYRKATKSPAAYDAFAKGFSLYRQYKRESNSLARKHLLNAIEVDPEYTEAFGLLGQVYLNDARYGWSNSPSRSIEKAKEMAYKALSIDDQTYLALSALSMIHLFERDIERCMVYREKAFAANPNSADSNAVMGWTLSLVGREKEAISYLKAAMRLSPFYPDWYLATLCDVYRLTGRYDDAIVTAKAIIDLNIDRQMEPGRLYLTAVLVELGRKQEAQEVVAEYLNRWPSFSLKDFERSRMYKDPQVTEKLINQLRQAGFSE